MIDLNLIRSFLQLGIVSVLAVLVQLLYIGILARNLSQDEFGFQVLVQVGLLFSVLICERGMAAALLVSKSEYNNLKNFRLPTIIFGFLISLLYLFYLIALANFYPVSDTGIFYWHLIIIPLLASVTGFFRVSIQLKENFKKIALMEITGHLIFLISIIFYWFELKISIIYFGWLLQHLSMLMVIAGKNIFWFFRKLEYSGIDKHSLNYIIERFFSGATPMFDRPVVSKNFTLSDVAIFDNILKLTLYPSGRIIPVVAKIIDPRVKRIDFTNVDMINSSYMAYSCLLLPFMVPYFYMIGFKGHEVVNALLGNGWLAVTENLLNYSIYGMATIIISLGSIFLYAAGHSSILKKWSIFTVIMNIICLFMITLFEFSFNNFLSIYLAWQLLLIFCFILLLKSVIKINFFKLISITILSCSICFFIGEFLLESVNIFVTYIMQATLIALLVFLYNRRVELLS